MSQVAEVKGCISSDFRGIVLPCHPDYNCFCSIFKQDLSSCSSSTLFCKASLIPHQTVVEISFCFWQLRKDELFLCWILLFLYLLSLLIIKSSLNSTYKRMKLWKTPSSVPELNAIIMLACWKNNNNNNNKSLLNVRWYIRLYCQKSYIIHLKASPVF